MAGPKRRQISLESMPGAHAELCEARVDLLRNRFEVFSKNNNNNIIVMINLFKLSRFA